MVHEGLDVPGADLLQPWDQEVVGVYEKLQEELDALLPNVEMV